MAEWITYASFRENLRVWFWRIFLVLAMGQVVFLVVLKTIDRCHIDAISVSGDVTAYLRGCDTVSDIIVALIGLAPGVILISATATAGILEVIGMLLADERLERAEAKVREEEERRKEAEVEVRKLRKQLEDLRNRENGHR